MYVVYGEAEYRSCVLEWHIENVASPQTPDGDDQRNHPNVVEGARRGVCESPR